MKVQFKYPRIVGGTLYHPGLHDLADKHAEEHKDNWFFHALVKSKDATIVEEPKAEVKVEEVQPEAEALPIAEEEKALPQPQKKKGK